MSFTNQSGSYAGQSFKGQNLNPNNPIRADSANSELNSLASGNVVLCAPALTNVQNDGQGLGYSSVTARLTVTSGAYSGSPYIAGWLLRADDGVILETYNTSGGVGASGQPSPPKARAADFTWPIDPVGQPCVVDAVAPLGAPICGKMQLLLWNQAGMALGSGAGSGGNSVNLFYSMP